MKGRRFKPGRRLFGRAVSLLIVAAIMMLNFSMITAAYGGDNDSGQGRTTRWERVRVETGGRHRPGNSDKTDPEEPEDPEDEEGTG